MSRRQRPTRLIPQQPVKRRPGLLPLGSRRNRPRRRAGGKSLLACLLWLLAGLLLGGGISLGLVVLYYRLLTSPHFCIKDINDIEIIGNQRLTRQQILDLAGLNRHTNLLALRPSAVEQRLVSHPWIAKAEVVRHWPNRLSLRLTERQPVALVQLEELWYLDEQGTLFKPASLADPHDFPVITGLRPEHFPAGGRPASLLLKQTLEFLNLLKESPPPLCLKQVAEIHVDSERGFSLYLLHTPLALDFGFEELGEKAENLRKVWPFLLQRGFLSQAGRLNLHQPERLVLSLKESFPGP